MFQLIFETGARRSLTVPVALQALLFLAFADGMYALVMLAIAEDGFWDAFYGTFGISIAIWVAMRMALELSRQVDLPALNRRPSHSSGEPILRPSSQPEAEGSKRWQIH